MTEVLDGLQDVLADAATSMAAGDTLHTNAEKRGWWAQRLAQDQRVALLVQQLDAQWLGAWRCLILQPQQPTAQAAAAAAARAIVSEHFCVLGGYPKDCSRTPVFVCCSDCCKVSAVLDTLAWHSASRASWLAGNCC